MEDSSQNDIEKPTFFSKMFNIIKTVAERAVDPTQDDGHDGDDSADEHEEEDSNNLVVDFRQKYPVGSTVRNILSTPNDSHPSSPPDTPRVSAVDDLPLESLELSSTVVNELELALAKEATTITTDVNPSSVSKSNAEEGHCARSTGESFCTRTGPNYKVNKLKAPSAPALLELMSADFIRTPCRVPDIGRYLDIPAEWSAGVNTNNPDIPPLFIVHAQIPNKWPTTVFIETTDGPCYSFILVYRITQATAAALADLSTAPPAVQLFAAYCQGGAESMPKSTTTVTTSTTESGSIPTKNNQTDDNLNDTNINPTTIKSITNTTTSSESGNRERRGSNSTYSSQWTGRTKVFLRCDNLDELKLPKFLHTYNAKPVLVRESATLFRGDGYLELDVNIKKFGLLANKTLPLLLSRLHCMDLHIGLCVESREEEEMPEGMLCSVRVHKVSAEPSAVPMWFVRSPST